MLANPGATNRSRGRDRNDSRIRNAQEAKPKDVYFRPEYGWVMSNEDVKKEKEVKAKYDEAAAQAANQVQQFESDYQRSVTEGKGQINAAYAQAAAKNKVPLVPVRVVNGNNVEATYMLPKTSVDQMNKDSFNKGKGSYTGNYVDGGQFYNVDVRVTGTGGKRGQELHDALRNASIDNSKAQEAANAALGKEKAATLAGFEAASAKNYAGAQQVWNSELANIQGAYSQRLEKGKAQYAESKKKYSDSITGVDMGLLESPTNKVNPNSEIKK